MKKNGKLTVIAMLAALAAILMYFESPLPLLPPFLKIDLSDIPVLMSAFVLGPLPAVAVTLVKDLIHLPVSQTAGVGELADFLITSSLVLTAGFIRRVKPTAAMTALACTAGVAAMTVVGALSNLYIILPFYEKLMPIDAILKMCAQVNPYIVSIPTYVLYAIVPFNLLKGGIVCAVTLPVFGRLSVFLERKFALLGKKRA